MPAMILDGTKIAADIRAEVASEVKTMAAAGVRPGWRSCWSATIQRLRFTFAAR